MNEAVFRDYRFDALRNALYHTARKSFLDFINRVINFFVIVFGASVVGKTAGHFPFDGLYLELATVIFATLQLVFDFGSKARLHEFLQRRYYDLLSEMKNDGSTDSKEQKKIFEKMFSLNWK